MSNRPLIHSPTQDRKTALPRVELPVRRVLTPGGSPARPWDIVAGDQVTIINLPLLFTALDQRQVFYVAETRYGFGRTVELTPATAPPRLAVVQARQGHELR